MGRLLAFFLVIFSALSTAASAAQCTLDPRVIIATSNYFSTEMTLKQNNTNSVTLQNKDDGRILVNFSMTPPPPIAGQSVSHYLKKVSDDTQPYLDTLKTQGRWAEQALFPYDPVAWRVTEETSVADVGPAFQGRMYVRFNDDCMMVADYIAPSSVNLLSRWHSFNAAITDLRVSANQYVTPGKWADEDTTPTGLRGILGGYGAPLVVSLIAFFLLGHLSRLDPPSRLTKTVIICASAIAFGAFAYQFRAYREELAALRYTDNALLLLTCGVFCLASLVLAQSATVIALMTTSVAGVTLMTMSYFDWTPDPMVNAVVGACMVFMGGLGFASWSAQGRATEIMPIQL